MSVISMSLNCPSCNAVVEDANAKFCEDCGTPLSAAAPVVQIVPPSGSPLNSQTPCQKCGSLDIDEDGFCNQCGHRNPVARDHQETIHDLDFAAISDRGIKHSRNEDDYAIDRLPNGTSILVVCDGVSSSTDPGSASTLAAQTACQSIVQDLKLGLAPDLALAQAIAKASAAVTELGLNLKVKGEPPSTTIVCAIAVPPETPTDTTAIYVAWVGDSRAYWLSDTVSLRLTQDHSWMNEIVAEGEMTEAEAEASPNAHAITRWLGADSQSDAGYCHDEPSFATHTVKQPGRLLVCSDGLWNYAPQPDALQALVNQAPAGDTIALTRSCLDYALSCGGQDNITIAVLNIPDK